MKKLTILLTVLIVSIGAAADTIFVNWDGTGDYTTIQAGIYAAISGIDTVQVAEGTYYENINFGGKNIILTSTDSNHPEDTIIDGSNSGSVVTFVGTETSACQLKGFTITNGYTNGDGGGIYGNSSSAEISECIITGNYARDDGGGVAHCDGAITNCTITDNTAIGYYDGSNGYGGGFYDCDGFITNCIIAGNTAIGYNDGSDGSGGGLGWCDAVITNCTVVGNTANDYGGGFYACPGSLTNCIIWDNSAVKGVDQLPSYSTLSYSCIQDWTGGGEGDITSNPLFVNPVDGDYHLQPRSHCIDAGTNSPPVGLPATDLDGNPRPIDGNNDGLAIADMGVYEAYPSSEPVIWLSEFDLYFSAKQGGTNPENQILQIKNWGANELRWSMGRCLAGTESHTCC